MTNFFLVKYYEKDTDNGKNLFNILLFITVFNVLNSIFAFFLLRNIFTYFEINFPFHPYTLIILITAFFSPYSTFLLIYFRVRKEASKYFIYRLLTIIIGTSISLYLVIQFNMGATGKLIGLLFGQFIIGLLTFYILKEFLVFEFDKTLIIQALKFCYPLVLAAIVYYPIINLDRILLERLNNPIEFGLYSIGSTIANYLYMVGFSLYQAFEPDVFKFVVQRNYKKLFKYISTLIFGLVILHFGFILLSKPIIHILTAGRYTESYKYANLFSISFFFLVLFSFTTAIIKAFKNTKILFVINLIVGGLSFLIVTYFIDYWSFVGGALSRIALFLTLFILSSLVVLYYLNINKLSENQAST